MLTAGFAGWPVTALVFRLARTIDDKADAGTRSAGNAARTDDTDDPSADVTVDGEITVPSHPAPPSKTEDTVPGDKRGAGKPGEPQPGEPGPGTPDEGTISGAGTASSTRILRGGAIIGILERLAVCLAILGGQPVAIAYVVAIKGLGRFAELKETPVAAERFIIGTLTSMFWAAGIAALAKVLFLS
jgi:hypothetical protein